jgi:hypothetical protein
MKKFISISIVCFVASGIIGCGGPSVPVIQKETKSPSSQWRKVVKKNTVYSYKAFVYRYKDDYFEKKRVAQARQKIKELVTQEYNRAKLLKNKGILEKFISDNNGRADYTEVIQKAKEDIRSIILTQYKECKTISDYTKFLDKYVEDDYVTKQTLQDTKNSIKELATKEYIKVSSSNSIETLKKFISEYEGIYSEYDMILSRSDIVDIHDKIAKLAYAKATKLNTIASYESFVTDYDYSDLTPKAREKIFELTYQKVSKINSISQYESFIDNYSYGDFSNHSFVSKAKSSLNILIDKEYKSIANTAKAYQRFVLKYKNRSAKSISKAKQNLQKLLNKEYKKALKINTLASYQSFIDLYPNTSQAESLEDNLYIKRYEDRNYSGLKIDIKIDMIKTDLKQQLGAKKFKQALLSFELLKNLNRLQGPALTYFYAKTLQETGNEYKSKKVCQEWLNKFDKKNKYYKKVLKLYSQVR